MATRLIRLIAQAGFFAAALPRRAGGKHPVRRLGTEYGGWWVPSDAVPGIAYCIGAGEDISFDVALHESGWQIRTCDPTPRAVAYVASAAPLSDSFRFAPVAIWSAPTTLEFYPPANADHVSFSATNLQGTTDPIRVPAEDLAGLMRHFGDLRVDLLKLDVEGAEHEVLASLNETTSLPSLLLVEFDQLRPLASLWASWRHLRRLGYRPVKAEKLNVTFVRQ